MVRRQRKNELHQFENLRRIQSFRNALYDCVSNANTSGLQQDLVMINGEWQAKNSIMNEGKAPAILAVFPAYYFGFVRTISPKESGEMYRFLLGQFDDARIVEISFPA